MRLEACSWIYTIREITGGSTVVEKTGGAGGAAALERIFAGGRASHAYLFLGPPSAKKEETVLRLAQILLCTAEKGNLFNLSFLSFVPAGQPSRFPPYRP